MVFSYAQTTTSALHCQQLRTATRPYIIPMFGFILPSHTLPLVFTPQTHHAVVPSTCPPTVPSSGGVSVSLSRSYSSGVLHLAVQAWMLAISSLRAALTRRWRLRELRPWNWGETMSDVKAWPQPPVRFGHLSVRVSRGRVGSWDDA